MGRWWLRGEMITVSAISFSVISDSLAASMGSRVGMSWGCEFAFPLVGLGPFEPFAVWASLHIDEESRVGGCMFPHTRPLNQ